MEAREQVVHDHQETHREVDRLRTEAEELGKCILSGYFLINEAKA